jgi:hypothetical protein
MAALLVLADVSCLLDLGSGVSNGEIDEDLWESLQDAVSVQAFGFPRSVVDELEVLGRHTGVLAWAKALGPGLRPFAPDIKYRRWVMKQVADMGYENGFESLDDADPSIADVMALARQRAQQGRRFVIATSDIGAAPLGPTMEEVCHYVGWTSVSPYEALNHLECGHLLH